MTLKGSYISVTNGELYVKGMHISPWKVLANTSIIETQRPRKIFLPKKKIVYYTGKIKEGGYTLLALSVYLK